MKPVSHSSNTRTLQAPAGWDRGDVPVEPLGITDQLISGLPFIWSFWEPDAAERAAIASGGKLVLSLLGRTMPPAMLMVEEPTISRSASAENNEAAVAADLDKIIDAVTQSLDTGSADQQRYPHARRVARVAVHQALVRAGFPPTSAARDVLAERQRQVDVEGWTAEHDDSHVNDEIAALACFYAMPPGAREWSAKETGYGDTLGQAIRPEGWDAKESDRRRELVKAAALVIAEIERLDRAAAGPTQGAGRAR